MHRTIKKTKKKTTISSAKKINEKEKRERKTYTLKYLQSKFIEKREKEKIFHFINITSFLYMKHFRH
jgi:hypothetical protein